MTARAAQAAAAPELPWAFAGKQEGSETGLGLFWGFFPRFVNPLLSLAVCEKPLFQLLLYCRLKHLPPPP